MSACSNEAEGPDGCAFEMDELRTKIAKLEALLNEALREDDIMRTHRTFLPSGWQAAARALLASAP
jgi:hypothetical protein